jgi:hypothetical protein
MLNAQCSMLNAQCNGGALATLAFDFDLWCGSERYVGRARINSAEPVQTGVAFPAAGSDLTVTVGDNVMLDGTRSLIVGTPIGSYQWTQVSGPSVMLSSQSQSSPGVAVFTAGYARHVDWRTCEPCRNQ